MLVTHQETARTLALGTVLRCHVDEGWTCGRSFGHVLPRPRTHRIGPRWIHRPRGLSRQPIVSLALSEFRQHWIHRLAALRLWLRLVAALDAKSRAQRRCDATRQFT